MAGSSPHEAVTNFRNPLRRALNCVTKGVFNAPHPHGKPDRVYKASLNGGTPAKLGDSGYSLQLGMSYEIVEADGEIGPWKVRTVEYAYLILRGRERIAGWHWHPLLTSDRAAPHMHFYSSDGKLHLPTGRVALEQVLMFTMTDLGVEPLQDDADKVIGGALDRFERYRTWP